MILELKGICPAIASTFTDTGEFDYDSYTHLIRTLIRDGCHGIVLFSIAGEYYKLTEEEEKRLVKITVEECRSGGAASIISVTKHATEVASKWARYYEDAGADCLMLLPPFFLKPGAKAIQEHIATVARSVKAPIMVQYAPEQTGVAVDPSVFNHLSNSIENISVYKIECKPPGRYISTLLDHTDQRVKIFVGNAGYQMIENFDRGAIGVVPGCSMYDVYLKIYKHYMAGEREKAVEIHNVLVSMLNHIRQNVEMIISFEKQILKRRGLIASAYCRRPAFESDDIYADLFDSYYGAISPYFEAPTA